MRHVQIISLALFIIAGIAGYASAQSLTVQSEADVRQRLVGQLSVSYAEAETDRRGHNAQLHYTVRADDRSYWVNPDEVAIPAEAAHGQLVELTKGRRGAVLKVLEDAEPPSVLPIPLWKVLIVPVWIAGTSAPATSPIQFDVIGVEAASNIVQHHEAGYGFTVDTVPVWSDIPQPQIISGNNGVSWCDFQDTAAKGRIAAMDAGYNPNEYGTVVTILPDDQCQTPLFNQRGQAELPGNDVVIWDHSYTRHVLTHELGHTFGHHHANALECIHPLTGQRVTYHRTCSQWFTGDTPFFFGVIPGPDVERGDPYEVMGRAIMNPGLPLGGFNSFLRNNTTTPGTWLYNWQVEQATGSGQVTLDRTLLSVGSGFSKKAVRLSIDYGGIRDRVYWIEYRAPDANQVTPDNFIGTPGGPEAGVLVRTMRDAVLGPGGRVGTNLLDGSPLTATFHDAALQIGDSIVTPEGAVINVNGMTANTADVSWTVPSNFAPPLGAVSISCTVNANNTVTMDLGSFQDPALQITDISVASNLFGPYTSLAPSTTNWISPVLGSGTHALVAVGGNDLFTTDTASCQVTI